MAAVPAPVEVLNRIGDALAPAGDGGTFERRNPAAARIVAPRTCVSA